MLRRLAVLAVVATALTSATPSESQAQLTIYGGASFPETPLDPGYHFGTSFRFTRLLGLRGDLNYTVVGGEDATGDVGIIGAGLSLQWNLHLGNLTPYGLLGGAYHNLNYDADIDSDDEWGVVGGLGLRLGEHLFFEARGVTLGKRHMFPVVLGWSF
jgi:hypothetical protein